MVRENVVTPADFIYPLFIHEEGNENVPIESMPGCERHTMDSLLREIEECVGLGVNSFVLFPKVPESVKNNLGTQAYNPDNLNNRAVRAIKKRFPEVTVCTDVALDPYSNQGHDGIVKDGRILNDEVRGRGERETKLWGMLWCCSYDGNIPYCLIIYDMRPFNTAIGHTD